MKSPLLFLLTSIYVCASCNEGNTREKEVEKRDSIISVQRNLILQAERRLTELEDESRRLEDYSTSKNNPTSIEHFYSLGASKETALQIQGQPTSINDFGNIIVYWYGSSYLTFTNGKLSDYSNQGNLKLKIELKSGSSKSQETISKKVSYTYVFCEYSRLVFDDIRKVKKEDNYVSKVFAIRNYNDNIESHMKECFIEALKQRIVDDLMFVKIQKFESRSLAVDMWQIDGGTVVQTMCPELEY